ncbi:9926_t:CDS:2, partial [Funneliformis geosporum]
RLKHAKSTICAVNEETTESSSFETELLLKQTRNKYCISEMVTDQNPWNGDGRNFDNDSTFYNEKSLFIPFISSLTLAQLANVLKLSRRSSKDSSDKYEEYEGSLGGDESNYEKEIDKFIVDYEIEFRNDFVVQILSEGELIIYVWIPLLRNAFLVKNEILAQEVVSTVFVSKLFECTYNGLKRSGTVEGFKTSSSCKDVRNTITSMSLINLKGTLHNIQSVEMGHGAFVSYTVTITC